MSKSHFESQTQTHPQSLPVETPAKREIVFDLSHMEPWREFAVVLCNDNEHSMDEVVVQLMKALNCGLPRAHELMLRAHKNGQATVAITRREQAMQIATILRQISLTVLLRQIN
jgi:ATP-dependent Clp protease adapter protein ClpS